MIIKLKFYVIFLTTGFSVETSEYKNIRFDAFDVSGDQEERITMLQRHYYQDKNGQNY